MPLSLDEVSRCFNDQSDAKGLFNDTSAENQLSAETHQIFFLMQEFYQFYFIVLSIHDRMHHCQPFLTTYNGSRHDFQQFKSFFFKKIFEN